MSATPKKVDVSPNNPCPFLRALVNQQMLPDDVAPIGEVSATIQKVAKTGDGAPSVPGAAIRAIALMANGLGPAALTRNGFGGLHLNELRNGPLDKKGVGSGILDANGQAVQAELARLDEFASDKVDVQGRTERGLDIKEITRMMNANFDRAKGRRRAVDRKLMDGEWPILLKVMGKQGQKGRYLSVDDVRRLFFEQRLPERMTRQLGSG